jgi:prepilin-type processing-associated H-X9-DG protein
MFNEVRAGIAPADPRGTWALGFPGSSVTSANALGHPQDRDAVIGDCYQPNDASELSDDFINCTRIHYEGIGTRDRMGCSNGDPFNASGSANDWPNWQGQARSQHIGGVNSYFADGSVRFISNNVAIPTWFYMLSVEDGRTYRYDF